MKTLILGSLNSMKSKFFEKELNSEGEKVLIDCNNEFVNYTGERHLIVSSNKKLDKVLSTLGDRTLLVNDIDLMVPELRNKLMKFIYGAKNSVVVSTTVINKLKYYNFNNNIFLTTNINYDRIIFYKTKFLEKDEMIYNKKKVKFDLDTLEIKK